MGNMPKRKREDVEHTVEITKYGKVTSAHQRKQIEEKLFHGKKNLHRALKIAKGFERQKLGRRLKAAAGDKELGSSDRINAEIEALKTLDLTLAAESHLYKTLLKNKAIAQSPGLPRQVTASQYNVPNSAAVNVTARLYNSNPVKVAMAEILANIRVALGLGLRPPVRKPGNARPGVEGSVNIATSAVEESVQSSASETFSNNHNRDEPGSHVHHPDGIQRTGDTDSFGDFDERITDFSRDFSADVSSNSDHVANQKPNPNARSNFDIDDELSLSSSESDREWSPEPSKARGLNQTTTILQRSGKPSFLPSLTMGGYWSGSEGEDISDVEAPPRKNRRGQRARQQIWEKKYGSKAKHLQKEATDKARGRVDERDKGWDLKFGAQEDTSAASGRNRHPGVKNKDSDSGGLNKVASGSNATQLNPRAMRLSRPDNSAKPIHPSWEAAQKAKEKKLDLGSFAGKKVVFD